MNLPHFIYRAPVSLKECANVLAYQDSNAQVLAGGSDLLVRMKLRLVKPDCLVSLSHIPEMKQITYDPEKGLLIGAGVTLSSLSKNPLIVENCRAIANTAELVATKQIRNTATLGGNVLQNTRCMYYNRSPVWGKSIDPCFKRGGGKCHVVFGSKRCFAVYQGDMAPLLIALNATALIVSKDTTETVPVESLFSNNGREPFQDAAGKIITHFIIPKSSLNGHAAYRKYRLRNGIDFPLAGVAAAVNNTGPVNDLRICLTGIASSPVLVPGIEEMAKGQSLCKELAREAGEFAYTAAHPLANLEGDPARRRLMIRILTEEILTSFIL